MERTSWKSGTITAKRRGELMVLLNGGVSNHGPITLHDPDACRRRIEALEAENARLRSDNRQLRAALEDLVGNFDAMAFHRNAVAADLGQPPPEDPPEFVQARRALAGSVA